MHFYYFGFFPLKTYIIVLIFPLKISKPFLDHPYLISKSLFFSFKTSTNDHHTIIHPKKTSNRYFRRSLNGHCSSQLCRLNCRHKPKWNLNEKKKQVEEQQKMLSFFGQGSLAEYRVEMVAQVYNFIGFI